MSITNTNAHRYKQYAKLFILAFILLLSAWSAIRNDGGRFGASVIKRDAASFCSPEISQLKTCQETSKNCSLNTKDVSKCLNVVEQAYRYINLGGCIHFIKDFDTCREACTTKGCPSCKSNEEKVVNCENYYVNDFFIRSGILSNRNKEN